jgi:hypothetical protein
MFIDYTQTFDMVNHHKPWTILKKKKKEEVSLLILQTHKYMYATKEGKNK